MNFQVNEIPIEKIFPNPYQTRKFLTDIEGLAKSIDTQGLQNPPTVRKLKDGNYEIIAGTRRLAAIRLLGWTEIPCYVKDLTDADAAALSITENLQREDLNPIEEALSYKMMMEQFSYTQAQVAELTGKSRPYITNCLGLLKIDPFLQACLICEELTVSHIRLIQSLPEEIPKYRVADIVMDSGLTVRELEEVVSSLKEEEKFFSWFRDIEITRIRIPLSVVRFELEHPSDSVVVDTSLTLLSGFEGLIQARKNGETVRAEVIYWSDWLNLEGCAPVNPSTSPDLVNASKSVFTQVLGELVGDTKEMYSRYPVHCVMARDDYLVFFPNSLTPIQPESA